MDLLTASLTQDMIRFMDQNILREMYVKHQVDEVNEPGDYLSKLITGCSISNGLTSIM